MSPLADRLAAIRERVAAAARRAGRDPSGVLLIGVSKRQPIAALREAYDAGLRHFGENYVQEALEKIPSLPPDIEWHMIGHLQSNKAKRVVEEFSALHTLDRPSLADALNKAAASRGTRLEVLLQVNVGEESTKSGSTEENAVALARMAERWPALRVRGLMAIPPYEEDPERVRPHFARMRALADRIAALGLPGVAMEELSMGMSHDFEVAIEEGATMVRVGTAIFGERD